MLVSSWIERARQRRALAGLDDQTLRDIGITRADATHEDFARRHHDVLLSIAQRTELEYVGIDCGETPDGELLVFEVDSGMTVHAMDPVNLFPYKQAQMRKVFRAFRQMLIDASGLAR